MVVKRAAWISVLMVLLIAGCSPVRDGGKSPRLTVSILPQLYMVQRIAGDRFPIDVLIPPGYSPATYSPTPSQIRNLAHSRVWFRIGHIPFEKAWTSRISDNNPGLKIVDTSVGVSLIQGGRHSHGKEAENAGVDPHIWLSPEAVRIQARNILKALEGIDPLNSGEYRAGHDRFQQEISGLDFRIRKILKSRNNAHFLVFHPAWGYFARDYGLEQISVEVEGKRPRPGDLAHAISMARKLGIHAIFIQKQFDTAAAAVVAREIGGRVVALDPLSQDWPGSLLEVARALEKDENNRGNR